MAAAVLACLCVDPVNRSADLYWSCADRLAQPQCRLGTGCRTANFQLEHLWNICTIIVHHKKLVVSGGEL